MHIRRADGMAGNGGGSHQEHRMSLHGIRALYLGGTTGAEVVPCSYLPFWEGVNRLGGGGGA